MKSWLSFMFGALLVCGCTEQSQYFSDGQVVEIEGREFFVRQPSSEQSSVYTASLNQTPGDALYRRDFSLPAFNVKAIEAVSGCKVDPSTVYNNSIGLTTASVSC